MSVSRMNKSGTRQAGKYRASAGRARARRSGILIMGRLIGLVKPLLPVMLLAIALGTIGYLCAIFLTILAGFGLMHIILEPMQEFLGYTLTTDNAGLFLGASPGTLFIALVVMAVMRGILHYGERILTEKEIPKSKTIKTAVASDKNLRRGKRAISANETADSANAGAT